MKILYLYTELMGYQIPVFKELVKNHNAELHVVSWDKKKLTPYVPPELSDVFYYPRSKFSSAELTEFAMSIDPDLVYVSGWQDFGYLPVVHKLKAAGKPIVVGLDAQWEGTLRQRLGSVLLRAFMLPVCFTHAWVAGPYQFEYARRMGFKRRNIIFSLLSCNSELFDVPTSRLTSSLEEYPEWFLYVGRFQEGKGIDILAKAYQIYRSKYKGVWRLLCIGNGELEGVLSAIEGITVRGFTSQRDLAETSRRVGAFVLASRREPWGVVVHEFAAAGLPLILSESVGALPVFLVNSYNGYRHAQDSAEDLAHKMHLISSGSAEKLRRMGESSKILSRCISPTLTAASLVSVLSP